MTSEIIIAGFGGQGVLSMGKILAYSALMQGQEVSWLPSYGPEMRGGTANVTVILSDKKISSPVLTRFDIAIVLNQPSLDKFEASIKPGGILIYDGGGISNLPTRSDISIFRIEAAAKSAELNMTRNFNMFVLGALLKIKPLINMDSMTEGLKKSLPERHHHLIPLNIKALEYGAEIIELN